MSLSISVGAQGHCTGGVYQATYGENFNAISQAWDFQNTDTGIFNLSMWYNDTTNIQAGASLPPSLLRVNQAFYFLWLI